jgi:hypothetical protein
MVNLNELHGRNLEYAPGEPTYARTKLLLHDCAFYTLFLYDRLVLVESGATNGQELQIGYVLGGNIASRTRTSSTTLLCEEILPIDRVLPGEDGTGNEWVYDLIFNNHCTDPGRCQAQVADPVDTDGDGDTDTVVAGTDFRFYYDFFKEKGSERRFDLKIPSRAGPGPSGADPGDADRGEEAGSVDVAACNPVVTDPPEW